MNLQATVWSEHDSPRLRYVLDWLLKERLGISYSITHDRSTAADAQYTLSYGHFEEVPSIHATTLLWETDIKAHPIPSQEWQGLYTLYHDVLSSCDIQFDMLAGIFYLISRYEEYLPFAPDKHGRFPASQSILYEVLTRPVIDEWIEALRIFLAQSWNILIPRKSFSYLPTYDIDIAWSYRFKGLKRTIGAALREAGALQWNRIKQRIKVLSQKEEDPYDSFVFLLGEHMMDEKRPIYFILSALQSSAYDKNIPLTHPRMAALISGLNENAVIGLHPSYYSDKKPELLLQEKAILERIVHAPVIHSRQHYIKLNFPGTYRSLLSACIEEDWSMGYSTHMGFRAGTSHSFLWYDLKDERITALRIHPFAFMDSTAHYDLGLSPEEAFNQLRKITASLQPCAGNLVTIMHNYSLGSDPEWAGWRSEYVRFLDDVKAIGKPSQR